MLFVDRKTERPSAGNPPDTFLVGLAVLDLLSAASEQQPLLCVVDDTQWLDRASAQVLGFVARRLLTESVGLIFGTRQPIPADLGSLPELEVTGLRDAETLPGRIEDSFLNRIQDHPASTRRLLLVAAAEPRRRPGSGARRRRTPRARPGDRGGRPARHRRTGHLPASAGPLGRLPGGGRR